MFTTALLQFSHFSVNLSRNCLQISKLSAYQELFTELMLIDSSYYFNELKELFFFGEVVIYVSSYYVPIIKLNSHISKKKSVFQSKRLLSTYSILSRYAHYDFICSCILGISLLLYEKSNLYCSIF